MGGAVGPRQHGLLAALMVGRANRRAGQPALGVCPSNGSGAVSGGCQTITRVEIFDPEPNVRL